MQRNLDGLEEHALAILGLVLELGVCEKTPPPQGASLLSIRKPVPAAYGTHSSSAAIGTQVHGLVSLSGCSIILVDGFFIREYIGVFAKAGSGPEYDPSHPDDPIVRFLFTDVSVVP
jgi:hypothetical protein